MINRCEYNYETYARQTGDSLFPVQNQPPEGVPLWIAQMAFADYRKRFGNLQSLDVIAMRGGFGQTEMIDHLASYANALEIELRTRQPG